MIDLTEKARESYGEMVDAIEKEIKEYPIKIQQPTIPTIPHVFAHMGHSRTPSGASVLSFTSSILSEPISENYPHSEPETDSKGYKRRCFTNSRFTYESFRVPDTNENHSL